MLQLGLGLETGNGYFFLFPYLKVTNTFVFSSWAEAWCKCDIMRFIRDWFITQYFYLYCCYAFDLAILLFFTKVWMTTMTTRTIFGGDAVGLLLLE